MAVSDLRESHFSFTEDVVFLEGQGEMWVMSEMLVTQVRSLEKQILQQHLQSEQLFRSLFEHNSEAVYLLDLEGNFLSGNPVFEKISGYPQEELYQIPSTSLVAPEDFETARFNFIKAAAGEHPNFCLSILHKQGYRVPLDLRQFPLFIFDQLVGVFGIARENREERRDDHRSQDVSNNSEMIFKFTLDGIFVHASSASSNLLGYEPAEIINRTLFTFLHKKDLKALLRLRKSLLSDANPHTITHRIRTKTGNYKWFKTTCRSFRDSFSDSVIEIIAISRGIMEQKNAEGDSQSRENCYRELVENSPDPIMICKDGRWLYANREGLKLIGASLKEELVGRNVYDFIHPAYHRIVEEQLREVAQGKEVALIEQKLIRLDGKVIDVEVKGIATIYQNEPALQVVVRDITEQKKTQEMLQNSEKLTLVGQLAAGIAHEIRNPLTALKGFLQLIQEDSREHKEYFSIMTSELARIELIVSELLVLAKPHSTYFQPRDLSTLIKHVVTLLDTEAIMKKVQIITQFEPDIPLINCDENQLKQAFINFLKNGIEAMTQGGDILIKVRKVNERVLIQFVDHGCGIPDDKIPKIGEPFYTTKESGTGLGLMVSNKIIQNHLGTIELTSQVGSGTTVTVTLPIRRENGSQSDAASST